MAKQKKKQIAPPQKLGDILVTEAIVERRKWSKQPTARSKLTLFPDGTSGDQSGESTESPPAAPDRSEARTAAAGGDSLFQSYGHCCDRRETDGLPVETDAETDRIGGPVFRLARAQRLTIYDAIYLELASRRGIALATRDQALQRAAVAIDVVLFDA